MCKGCLNSHRAKASPDKHSNTTRILKQLLDMQLCCMLNATLQNSESSNWLKQVSVYLHKVVKHQQQLSLYSQQG